MRLFTPYTLPAFLVDFLLNCGITLFATTIYSSTPWVLNLLLLLPAVILYVLERPAPSKRDARPHKKDDNAKDSKLDPLPVKPFITNYRGAMMVITCVAILAVDFRVFPRRFAKVENWGTSLMDMGGVVRLHSWHCVGPVVPEGGHGKTTTTVTEASHVIQTLHTAPRPWHCASHICQGSGLRRTCLRVRHPLEFLLHTRFSTALCRPLSDRF
jgi:hypothetical protein